MKPSKKKNYPHNWKWIRNDLIMNRANFRCEECGMVDGAIVYKDKRKIVHELDFDKLKYIQDYSDSHKTSLKDTLKLHGLTRIYLTVAHLDRDTTNNDYSNLKVLCPQCHFRYDKHDNLFKRRRNLKFNSFSSDAREFPFPPDDFT